MKSFRSKPYPSPALLLQMLREVFPRFQQSYAIRSLGLFGSYARGTPRRSSDLDLLVEFDRVPTLLEFVRLERELGQALGIKVDLVMKSALKSHLRERILSETIPL